MGKRRCSDASAECVVDKTDIHRFSSEEIKDVRTELLAWYDSNKRDLPWRKQAQNIDHNQRAYAVWVSEIMLQQTQVATVIDYYNRWMTKWPTLEALSKASLEEVNEMWSGLGYYSRGRRLHEGARKVVEQMSGEMPRDADSLLKHLPGVGRYTAGAIASIAYNQVTGIVDGNVIRVLCRLRTIGADSTSTHVADALWRLATELVDTERPGDFNQAMMELGATVCTPKSPNCIKCPIRNTCTAYTKVKKQTLPEKLCDTKTENNSIQDIECLLDNCKLCLQDKEIYNESIGVMNYPRKGKKKAAREARTAVCVLCRKTPTDEEFLITQRPLTGLLAGLWEFPSRDLENNAVDQVSLRDVLQEHGVEVACNMKKIDCGQVVHVFSHIHQTYLVEAAKVDEDDLTLDMENIDQSKYRWVTRKQFAEAAISTAMRKVFKAFEAAENPSNNKAAAVKRPKLDSNQKSIASFFKPKSK